MVSTYTPNKVLEEPANGDYVDTWNVPVNKDMTFIDVALGNTIVFNATAGSQTLSQATSLPLDDYSYLPMFITITGAISNDVTYTIPSGVGGTWIVRNLTTDATGGPWSIFFDYAGGGTSVEAQRNVTEIICCDSTPSGTYRGVYKPSNTPADDSVTTAAIQDGAVTYAKINSAALATVDEYRAGPISNATFTGIVAASTNMTVTGVTGTIIPGMVISGGSPAIASGTTIVSQSSGTTGGAGVYVISSTQTATGSMTGAIPSTIIPTATAWDSAAYVALTDGATITPDFAFGYNFSVTLNGVRTLANPSNAKVGQSGIIAITEGSTQTTASFTGYIGSSFNGTVSGTTLTVTGSVGTIILGAELTGSGVPAGTTIVAYGTASGGDGTYTISNSLTISSSTAMTTPNTELVASSVTGTIYVGMEITTGAASGTTILSQSSGTTGGAGVYVVGTQQRVSSTSMIGSIGPYISTYGSYYKFPNGVKPTFVKTAGSLNVLSYTVLPGPIVMVTSYSGVQ